MLNTESGKQKTVVGIYAYEIAGVMSKLVRLWASMSDEQVLRLRKYISDSVAFKMLVSRDDDDFIKCSIQGDWFENMIPLIKFMARVGNCYCSDSILKDFEHVVCDFITKDVDPFKWKLPGELMGKLAKKMERQLKKMEKEFKNVQKLAQLESTLKDVIATLDGPILLDFQEKVELKRLKVEKRLKEGLLWNMTFDDIGKLLARFVFTIFSRIKTVFGIPQLMADADSKDCHHVYHSPSILSNHRLLDFPPDTLGVAALHYANIVIRIESLANYPLHIYGCRAEVYNMLHKSLRAELSKRLPSIYSLTESVRDLAAEKNVAMAEILEWLAPLAHNTKKWLSNRNIEQKTCGSRSHVLLVETLFFANQQKTEEIIVELIVGMQYSCPVFLVEECAFSLPLSKSKASLLFSRCP